MKPSLLLLSLLLLSLLLSSWVQCFLFRQAHLQE
jgi:hypothetical protein